MKNKAKVVMLPNNEKATCIGKYKDTNELVFNSIGKDIPRGESQHLYILSDDKIEEGDWVIIGDKYIVRAIKNCGTICYESFNGNALLYFRPHHKKIIATTDESLGKYIDGNNPYIGEFIGIKLPSPSIAFVKKFIKEYNKGNIITDVMVEYDMDYFKGDVGLDYKNVLKIDSNNEITITKVKDNWNREEVITKCLKMQHDYSKYKESCHYGPNMREIADWTNKWIEKNL